MAIKFFRQRDNVDCGPTCLRIVANYYGKDIDIEYLRNISYLTKEGTSLASIKEAAEEIGLGTLTVEVSNEYLCKKGFFPCILFWKKNHFVVLYKIMENNSSFFKKNSRKYYLADPAHGKVVLNENDFCSFWESNEISKRGFALFLEPKDEFYTFKETYKKQEKRKVINFIIDYFKSYNKNYIQVALAMIVSTMISLILPFLTQNIVDIGITQKDINFILVILIFQIGLFISGTLVDTIRSHLLLHISSRINITIIDDYLKQLMALPISFFESKMVSDLIQRVNDNRRIEDFISSSLINTFFSSINLVVFSIILALFNVNVFFIFLIFSAISIVWTIFFLERRRQLDYKRFNELSNSGDYIYEMLGNINEVKINSYEMHMREEWQKKQYRLFKISIDNLKLEQYQQVGTEFLEQLKNILITFISAYSVINGSMTLGMMLSVSYVLSQVNSPVKQLISFIRNAQFASIGIDRLSEVFFEDTEEKACDTILPSNAIKYNITLKNISYRYGNKHSPLALNNLSLSIPNGKVTAIVGASGSGKSTLIKLLLKFHKPTDGKILVEDLNLEEISSKSWRMLCGTVLQEGHLFNDTMERNIILSDDIADNNKLEQAINIANLKDIIEVMPLGLNTKLGTNGVKLSSGQKQRILIARAIYKTPSFIFFDEATNSLDANNEKEIVEKLNTFFKNKTVVIVAHRLSTVKNADQIVVLDKGLIVEVGTHKSLIKNRGYYYNLIKNQLELDT